MFTANVLLLKNQRTILFCLCATTAPSKHGFTT